MFLDSTGGGALVVPPGQGGPLGTPSCRIEKCRAIKCICSIERKYRVLGESGKSMFLLTKSSTCGAHPAHLAKDRSDRWDDHRMAGKSNRTRSICKHISDWASSSQPSGRPGGQLEELDDYFRIILFILSAFQAWLQCYVLQYYTTALAESTVLQYYSPTLLHYSTIVLLTSMPWRRPSVPPASACSMTSGTFSC